MRDHFSHPEEATVLVHTQNPAPVLGAAVMHGVVDGNAGVIHQNIQPFPVCRHDVRNHSLPVLPAFETSNPTLDTPAGKMPDGLLELPA